MKLPHELRIIIFEHAFGSRLYPVSTVAKSGAYDPVARSYATVHWGFGNYNAHDWRGYKHRLGDWLLGEEATTADYSVPRPNLALLRTRKQVYAEARQAGWENTRKCFLSPTHILSVLDAGLAPKFNWLNKLILDFSMNGWFDFFGVEWWPHFHVNSATSKGYLLPALATLTHLQIWFCSPDDGSRFSPWGQASTDNSPYECCQRVMVDWVMTLAWPFIMHLRKVIIGGAVKKDSKKKWDAILAMPTKTIATYIDYVVDERAILTTPPSQL